MQRFAVLGGGSFGTALASLFARQGVDVCFWMRGEDQVEAIRRTRRNADYFPDFELSPKIRPTSHFEEAFEGADAVIITVPSQFVRDVLTKCRAQLPAVPLVLAAKGIENDTLMTLEEVIEDVLGQAWAERTLTLSGPSFAREVMLNQPTAVVLACRDLALADKVCARVSGGTFRAYTSTDVVGVEMGGALKNVMAIAAGALTGMGLGDNSRAALMTRGLAEITRMAVARGAHPMTLAGLAGFGDLVLTCTGALSRNRAIGQALGEGKTLEQAIAEVKQVAEGVRTTMSAHQLAKRLGVDAPITAAVYRVLYEGVPVKQAVVELLSRPLKHELEY